MDRHLYFVSSESCEAYLEHSDLAFALRHFLKLIYGSVVVDIAYFNPSDLKQVETKDDESLSAFVAVPKSYITSVEHSTCATAQRRYS